MKDLYQFVADSKQTKEAASKRMSFDSSASFSDVKYEADKWVRELNEKTVADHGFRLSAIYSLEKVWEAEASPVPQFGKVEVWAGFAKVGSAKTSNGAFRVFNKWVGAKPGERGGCKMSLKHNGLEVKFVGPGAWVYKEEGE